MPMKTLQCRDHGGTFTVIAKRGRPPVSCTVDNPCSRAPEVLRPNATSAKRARSKMENRAGSHLPQGLTKSGEAKLRAKFADELREPASETPNKAPESSAEARLVNDASLTKAKAAKDLLEAQGWICVGHGKPDVVNVLASRGEETLFLSFRNGELVEQSYMLWDVDKPSNNGMPANRLTFDTDEMTDSELIRALSGMRVTWWNKLASNTETGTISPQKIVIEHSYAGNGDETPADRIVKFIDHGGVGFRAFRVGALLKVG